MTPEQRRITQEQIDGFEATLRDGMRPLKLIERGYDPIIVEAEERGMRSMIADLKKQLSDDVGPQAPNSTTSSSGTERASS
jgi:hypothetical protein